MATFYQCPPAATAPAGATTITTNAQLDAFINAREADDAAADIQLVGNFREIMIDGYTGPGLNFYGPATITFNGSNPKGGSAIARVKDSRNVHFHNIEFHGASTGNNGAIWGVVFGQSFENDPRSGPVTDSSLNHSEVHHVQQETVKVSADGTKRIDILCNEIHDTAQDTNKTLGEAIYVGEGNDVTGTIVEDVLIKGNDIYNATNDVIDIKIGSRRVIVEDNTIHDSDLVFGAAVTVGAQNVNPGFTGDHIIRRNRIWNIGVNPDQSFTSLLEGIEIGTTALIENNVIWNFTGRGINLIRQFGDSGKVVTVRHNTIDASNGVAAYGINVEAPQGGSNNGQIDADCNLYVGTHFVGTMAGSANDAKYVSGFAGGSGTGGQYALVSGSPHIDAAANKISEDICLEGRPQGGGSDFGAFEFLDNLLPEAVSDSFPGVECGTFVSWDLAANDTLGDPANAFYITAGSLPPGLTLDIVTGVVSGTVPAPSSGVWVFEYAIQDSDGDVSFADGKVEVVCDETAGRLRCILIGG